MTPDDLPPPEARDVEALLRRARFEPRASLGPELAGRWRRGERPRRPPRWRGWHGGAVLLGVATAALLVVRARDGAIPRTVDRCCFDLDGQGAADDGLLLRREGDAVAALIIYEDTDGSRRYREGKPVRFRREGGPSIARTEPGLTSSTICCADYDGDGPDDDALLVLRRPGGDIAMAALLESRERAPRLR